MSAATDLQALLRFLSQDAKVPLASAMSKVKDLQKANLDSPDEISKAKIDDINAIFTDDKIGKQVLSAAKRVAKKRAAGDDPTTSSSPRKKSKKDESLFSEPSDSPAELEASLALPTSTDTEDDLKSVTLYTNRAPLALAFVLTLLKYTMPTQPLSSRLSLAQGYIGVTSKARALYLGIDKGVSAEEEGFGEGQPSVWITGKQIRILRRWGYEWKDDADADGSAGGENATGDGDGDREPPLWALDLEALKKSNTLDSAPALGRVTKDGTSNLPIHTPQAARSYLLKAFDTASSEESGTPKKQSAAAKVAEKERNLSKLLRALDLLYESWATTLTPQDLDKRTWGWYVKVRPAVAEGAAGWGGKNSLKLGDILALRRVSD